MEKIYRKLYDNELSYLKYEELANNFFQIVFECEKYGIDIVAIDGALKKLCDVSPYLNLFIENGKYILKNRNLKLKIIKETLPFNGYNFNDIDIFSRPLTDDLMDVYTFNSQTNDYLLFKFNHSYVDGQGALYIIKMLISILNNKNLNFDIGFESDYKYAIKKGIVRFKEHLGYKNKIKELSKSSDDDYLFIKRVKISKNTNAVLSKVINVLNSYYINDNLVYLIPTSIRNKEDEKNYISNLTLPLYLNINQNDTWNEIYLKIYKALKEKRNMNISNTKYGWIMRKNNYIFKSLIRVSKLIQNKTRKYFTCGSITNLGIIDLQSYKCDKVKFSSVIDIPFYQPLFPLALAIVENMSCIEIVLVTHSIIISEKNAERMLEKIKNILEKD